MTTTEYDTLTNAAKACIEASASLRTRLTTYMTGQVALSDPAHALQVCQLQACIHATVRLRRQLNKKLMSYPVSAPSLNTHQLVVSTTTLPATTSLRMIVESFRLVYTCLEETVDKLGVAPAADDAGVETTQLLPTPTLGLLLELQSTTGDTVNIAKDKEGPFHPLYDSDVIKGRLCAELSLSQVQCAPLEVLDDRVEYVRSTAEFLVWLENEVKVARIEGRSNAGWSIDCEWAGQECLSGLSICCRRDRICVWSLTESTDVSESGAPSFSS